MGQSNHGHYVLPGFLVSGVEGLVSPGARAWGFKLMASVFWSFGLFKDLGYLGLPA